ncbi:MAG: hypothetical protein IIA59_01960 [Candidatus Marinimicrobia bacterium]|nr:hypothetical protein [Candidatus Neomarinimicrobiota bacterium]
MMRFKTYFLLAWLLLLVLSPISGKKDKFSSHWRGQEIVIDGDQQEWSGKLVIPKRENIAIGIMNDDSYLYVTMSTSDRRTMMQIMRMGLTVWFDPGGKKKKVLGIKYPIGGPDTGMRSAGGRNRGSNEMPDLESQIEALQESQLWIEVLGPDKNDITRLSISDGHGIKVEVGSSPDGRFVYELRIPLERTPGSPYAIYSSLAKTVGIGFETGAMDLQAMRGQRGGGMRSGGRQGGGGMRGGGGRGGGMRGGGMRGGGAGQQMPKPFKYWARVSLATGP